MKLFLTKENHEKFLQAIDDHIEKDLKYKFEKMKALNCVKIEQKNASDYESMDIHYANIVKVNKKKSFLNKLINVKAHDLKEDFGICIGYACIKNDKLNKLFKVRKDLVNYLLFAECIVKYRIDIETRTDFEFDYDKLTQFIHLVHFYLATQREENPNTLDYRNLNREHYYRIYHLLGIDINSSLVIKAYTDYYFDSDYDFKENTKEYFISVPSIQDNFIRFNIEFNEEEKEVMSGILDDVIPRSFSLDSSIRDLYLAKSVNRDYLSITVRDKNILYIRVDSGEDDSLLYTFSLNNIQTRTISNGNTAKYPLPVLKVSNGNTSVNICCTMDEFEYMIS